MSSDKVWQATTGFVTDQNGRRIVVPRGATFRDGHPLVAACGVHFREWKPDHEWPPPPEADSVRTR